MIGSNWAAAPWGTMTATKKCMEGLAGRVLLGRSWEGPLKNRDGFRGSREAGGWEKRAN